jgi:hypothetical protein
MSLEYCTTLLHDAHQALLRALPPDVAEQLSGFSTLELLGMLMGLLVVVTYGRLVLAGSRVKRLKEELKLVRASKTPASSSDLTKTDRAFIVEQLNMSIKLLSENTNKQLNQLNKNVADSLGQLQTNIISNIPGEVNNDSSLETIKDMHEKTCNLFEHAMDTLKEVVDRTVENDGDEDE